MHIADTRVPFQQKYIMNTCKGIISGSVVLVNPEPVDIKLFSMFQDAGKFLNAGGSRTTFQKFENMIRSCLLTRRGGR